jgi:hypothetical protein
MKKLLTYLFIAAVGLFLFGCDKPAPTELFDDSLEELAEYEILGKDINDEFYSNGSANTKSNCTFRNKSNRYSWEHG